MFVLQGELDDNVLPAVQEHFVATYRAALSAARRSGVPTEGASR